MTFWADYYEKAKNQVEIAKYLFRYLVAACQVTLYPTSVTFG